MCDHITQAIQNNPAQLGKAAPYFNGVSFIVIISFILFFVFRGFTKN